MNVSGNTILITGGGSGIGLALAEALVAKRNTVIIAGRNATTLAQAQKKCHELITFQCDISDDSERMGLVGRFKNEFPAFNILINNAAVANFTDWENDPDAFEKISQEIKTNYLGPVRLTQLFAQQLQAQRCAAVVNITSLGAFLPLVNMPGYSASKAALHSFSQTLRFEWRNSDVRVFEVILPPVDTSLVSEFHMRKMSTEVAAKKIIQGFEKNNYELVVGSARAMRWLHRLAPRLAEQLANHATINAVRRKHSSG